MKSGISEGFEHPESVEDIAQACVEHHSGNDTGDLGDVELFDQEKLDELDAAEKGKRNQDKFQKHGTH